MKRHHTFVRLLFSVTFVLACLDSSGCGGSSDGHEVSFTNGNIVEHLAGAWSSSANMRSPRTFHTATLLSNGKVLVTGGMTYNAAIWSTEVYDPSSGTWSPSGNMSSPRAFHTATLLPNGKVLVAGGVTVNAPTWTTAVYNPAGIRAQ